DTSSISFVVPFISDTNLFINSGTPAVIYGSATPLTAYPNDINGTLRNFPYPTMGAHEFTGSYADSVAPRIFNYTDLSQCFSGPILLSFRIYDRLLSKDTLYYRVNGGGVSTLQAVISTGIYPMSKSYLIPQQPSS